MHPNPPANDGPREVLIAAQPHENSALGAAGRFLLRHRGVATALLTAASCVLVLFAWTLANGEEVRGNTAAVALGDSFLDVPAFDVRGWSGSHRVGGSGSSDKE